MDNQTIGNPTMPPMPDQGQAVPQPPQAAQAGQQPSQPPQQASQTSSQLSQATPSSASMQGSDSNSQSPPNNGLGQSAVTVNPPDEPKKGSPVKLIAIGGVLLLVVIIIGGLALIRNQNEGAETAQTAENPSQEVAGDVPSAMQERPIPTLDPSMAAVTFATADSSAQATVGEETSVQITADSLGADVNGYDLLLPYDTAAFEIVEAVSLQDAFQIYQFDRGDYYAITGIKLLNVTDPTVFDSTPIIELRIIPKREGNLYLEVMEERGKETSKMVDNEVRIIKPQFQPIKLEIR